MNTEKRINLFQRELSYILDANVREFAKLLLEHADEYFFNVPASSSGKYHPDFARGNGGLVRHTKAVAFFTHEYTRASIQLNKINAYEADLLVVAAIAHDIKKQGNGEGRHTVSEHPQLAAEYVEEIWEKYGQEIINEESVAYICDVVKSHMGPWSSPVPSSHQALIVFFADYTASRKEILGLDFIDDDNSEPAEVYTPPTLTLENYKFDFGKTKGLTIKESYEKEPGYIKWMANKEGFGNVEVQNLVKEFLKNV